MGNATGRRWMLGLAVVACVSVGAYVSRATAGAPFKPSPPVPAVIATVDLEEIIKNLEERKQKEAALSAKATEYKTRITTLEDEAKSDKAKYEAEPDGPNKVAMGKALREKLFRMEFEGQYATKVLGEMQGEMLRELYQKINDAVRTIAQRNAYHLVMTSDEKAQVNGSDPDSVKRAIALKRMLYVDPAMDITADVVAYLNNQFAVGATTPAPAPAPAPKKKP
jgi:Skp family chaperone for outer membrane proteins